MANALRYPIGADTRGIDAAWAKIRRDAQATGAGIRAAMGNARTGVDSLMAPLRAVPALFAAIGATALVAQMRNTAEAVADIGRQAKQAGLDIESFQELKFVAEQNRIGVDILTDGMKELNLRADEFVATSKGSAAEAFGRLGFTSEDLAQKLKDPSALLTEIIGKLEQFDQAARIRISDELFGGTAGERFVELVDQGEKGIRDQIHAARDLGIVMDAEMIKKAEEVDKKFNVITSTIGTKMKEAIVNATDAWFKFLDSFKDFKDQQKSTLEAGLASDYAAIKNADERIARQREALKTAVDKLEVEELINQTIAEREDIVDSAMKKRDKLDRMAGWSPEFEYGKDEPSTPRTIDTSVEFIRRFREELALSNRERTIAAETQRILNDASAQGASLTEEQARALAEEAVRRKEAEAASKSSTKTTDKETEALARVIAALEHELSLLGKTETEKRIANELRNAGADAASREGERIAELVTQIEAQKAAEEALKKAQEDRLESLDNLFQMGGDALMAMVDNSLKAEDAVKRLALQLALAAAQAALLGTGPLAGLFGGGGGGGNFLANLAGIPSFDTGGWTGTGNRRKIAGVTHAEEFVVKAGPARQFRPMLEAINAGRDIGLYSAQQTMGEAGQSGGLNGNITLHVIGEEGPMFRPTIRAESEDVAVRISGAAVKDYDDTMPDRVQQINQNPRLR